MKRQALTIVVMAFCLINNQTTCRAADDVKAQTEATIKTVSAQLMSGEPQKVQEAIGAIQQLITKDPKAGITALTTRWNTPLFFAKRYDDIASLTQRAVIYSQSPAYVPMGEPPVELLQQMCVRALISAGRGDEALAAAKSLYNVTTMRNTSVAIDLVAQALAVAHKDIPGIGKKFRLQQLEGASTNAPPETITKTPYLLANVKVDAKLYEATITEQMNVDNVTLATLKTLGNLYLLADQPKKAEEVFRRIYEIADQSNLAAAIEGIARSIRAQDGNIARANAYIIAERNNAQ